MNVPTKRNLPLVDQWRFMDATFAPLIEFRDEGTIGSTIRITIHWNVPASRGVSMFEPEECIGIEATIIYRTDSQYLLNPNMKVLMTSSLIEKPTAMIPILSMMN